MTDQELKKLHRSDLLELLIAQEKENEQLRSQVAQLKARLEDRTIALEQAGSIAEASLQINGVFRAAQDAAAQYLENIRRLSGRQEEICRQMEEESRQAANQRMAETEEACRRMEEETRRTCQEQLSSAQQATDRYWTEARQRMEEYCAAHEELQKFLGNRGGKDFEA